MDFKRSIIKHYINLRGWNTKRKIIVIESDDWGSVRMASSRSLNNIKKKYPNLIFSKFVEFDGLEKTEDLEFLFELLYKFKDFRGNHPSFTALSLSSNPDFEKIRKNDFKYHSQSVVETYNEYNEPNLLKLWRDEGIKNNLLFPQFHGLEHLHPERYVNRIKNINDYEYTAFMNDSIIGGQRSIRSENFLAAFEYNNLQEQKSIEKRTLKGLLDFEKLFGFRSRTFCPSQSIYGEHLFEVLKENGIKVIQAGQQFRPQNGKIIKVNHYWGDATPNGIIFTRRNCTFETYACNNTDHVSKCLKEIEIAFRCGKPAVINSHRINYTSRINKKIRDFTLRELERLLVSILKKWPNVEFVNSSELANIITGNEKKY